MNCPVDGTTLLMSERQGIEVDYCPECRGIWLDRGELDKLLDRARAEDGRQGDAVQSWDPRGRRRGDDDDDRRSRDRYDGDRRGDSRGYRRKKKESPFEFLGDIFG